MKVICLVAIFSLCLVHSVVGQSKTDQKQKGLGGGEIPKTDKTRPPKPPNN